jgi:hypothetical protein
VSTAVNRTANAAPGASTSNAAGGRSGDKPGRDEDRDGGTDGAGGQTRNEPDRRRRLVFGEGEQRVGVGRTQREDEDDRTSFRFEREVNG